MTTAQDKNHDRIESCAWDCAAARRAIQAEREIAEHQEGRWELQAWQVPTEDGSLRLTLAGYPYGRVSTAFRRKWLLALSDAALAEARLINEQERL